MQIRRMVKDDLPKIMELERKIFPDPWSASSFIFEMENNTYSLPLVLEEKKEILGYAVVWKIFEEFHIANIAIRPDSQGKGLGNMLFETLLSLADDSLYAILEVREKNTKAINLYRKFGFKTILTRPRYYKNGENALVMQKILKKEKAK